MASAGLSLLPLTIQRLQGTTPQAVTSLECCKTYAVNGLCQSGIRALALLLQYKRILRSEGHISGYLLIKACAVAFKTCLLSDGTWLIRSTNSMSCADVSPRCHNANITSRWRSSLSVA